MAKIEFSASSVKTTINGLTNTYQSLTEKLDELNKEKEKISEFWDSDEAMRYLEKLENVTIHFNKFKDKYDNYLSLLESTISTYEKDQQNFMQTVNTLSKKSNSKDGDSSHV